LLLYSTLSRIIVTGVARLTIKDVDEPCLLQIAFLQDAPQGRMMRKKADGNATFAWFTGILEKHHRGFDQEARRLVSVTLNSIVNPKRLVVRLLSGFDRI
jgi:predicted neuraminidase